MTARESIFEQLRRIPADLMDIHDQLENWAAWSRDRMRKGHCRSIEFRYVPTREKDGEDRKPRAEWDSLAAEALHAHVCALPEKSRWLIHLHIIHWAPEGYIRRKLAIRRDDLARELHQAMRMVRNRAKQGSESS